MKTFNKNLSNLESRTLFTSAAPPCTSAVYERTRISNTHKDRLFLIFFKIGVIEPQVGKVEIDRNLFGF
jgi:hypothetical protein